ncbi:MAG: NADH-quinone oxidoreductase subunit C [Coriobacteriia bacterium]|nr:NADH-quinone oxidoreductase subunit C [Coriobacteriia bacterium]
MDPQVFINVKESELRAKVEQYHTNGWRFVNINGSTVEEGVEVIYSFSKGEPFENLRLVVANGTHLPSVTDLYPNAFFFENETHDLFGTAFDGISIDFGGEFYTVSVPTPMNPASAQAQEALANNTYGAANYGDCEVPEPAAKPAAKADTKADAASAKTATSDTAETTTTTEEA